MPLKSYPVPLPVAFSDGIKILPSVDLAEYNDIDEIDLPAAQALFYREGLQLLSCVQENALRTCTLLHGELLLALRFQPWILSPGSSCYLIPKQQIPRKGADQNLLDLNSSESKKEEGRDSVEQEARTDSREEMRQVYGR